MQIGSISIDGDMRTYCMYVRPIALNIFFELSKEIGGRQSLCSHFLFSHSFLLCTRYTTKHGAALSLPSSVFRLASASHFVVSLHGMNMNKKEIPISPHISLSPSFSLEFFQTSFIVEQDNDRKTYKREKEKDKPLKQLTKMKTAIGRKGTFG